MSKQEDTDKLNAALRIGEAAVANGMQTLGLPVDATDIAAGGQYFINEVLMKKAWKGAEQAGADAAAKITTVAEAEKAAEERK